jgi:hypothetical protein
MNRWEAIDSDDVRASNRQFAVAIVEQAAAQYSGVYLEIATA